MSNRLWDQLGVPHKGWELVGVEDVRSDGQAEEDTSYDCCEMCGNERIRFVHLMYHSDIGVKRVGSKCAEKMGEDLTRAKAREQFLMNRSKRRANWLTRKWRTSKKGNDYIRLDGRTVGVSRDARQRWGFWVGFKDRSANVLFSPRTFSSEVEAKLALFDHLYPPDAVMSVSA